MNRIDGIQSGVTLFKGEKREWCCTDPDEKNCHGTAGNPCGTGVVVSGFSASQDSYSRLRIDRK
jgi:hypothetical protein